MPSVEFNLLQPRFGRVVLRRHAGKFIFTRPPQREGPLSPSQLLHQRRFKEAAAYTGGILRTPARRAVYEAIAREPGQTLFGLVMAEFIAKPVIREVDTSGFHGHANDALVVRTRPDLPIDKVLVTVRGDPEAPVESGEAVKQADGEYRFALTQEPPANTPLFADITVRDVDGIEVTRAVELTKP